jgi:hypothetical protein
VELKHAPQGLLHELMLATLVVVDEVSAELDRSAPNLPAPVRLVAPQAGKGIARVGDGMVR